MSSKKKFIALDQKVGALLDAYRNFDQNPKNKERYHLIPVATAMGITYQQLQKNLSGENRLSMQRLLLALDYLGVNPSMFIARLATGAKPQAVDFLSAEASAKLALVAKNPDIDKLTGELLGEYLNLADGKSLIPMAESIGVIYQQLQKYINGENRIAVSRLLLGLSYLGVNPSIFAMRLYTNTAPSLDDFLYAPATEERPIGKLSIDTILSHLVGAFLVPAALNLSSTAIAASSE